MIFTCNSSEIKKSLEEAQAKLACSEQEKEGLKQQTSDALQQVNQAKAQVRTLTCPWTNLTQ